MHYILWDISWVVIGLPCSYLLSRRYSSLRQQNPNIRDFTRKQSLQIATAIWLDGLVLVVAAEASRKYLWIPFLVWIVLNYSALIVVLMKRRSKKQPT